MAKLSLFVNSDNLIMVGRGWLWVGDGSEIMAGCGWVMAVK